MEREVFPMKRWLPVFTVLAALAVATTASADQRALNLSWTDCASFGTSNMNFTCDSNSGTPFVMVASFLAPDSVTALVAIEAQIDLIFGTATVPPWWQLRNQTGQTGQCRNGALSADEAFLSFTNCQNAWATQGTGGVGSYTIDPFKNGTTNRVRIISVVAVGSSDQAPLIPGTEYYGLKFTITRTKTVGNTPPSSCNSGCSDPVCAVLNRIACDQPNGTPGGNPAIFDPPNGGNRAITWQGGVGADCNLVPVKNTTWGQIKTLYR
jgi:hypothetical protein